MAASRPHGTSAIQAEMICMEQRGSCDSTHSGALSQQ